MDKQIDRKISSLLRYRVNYLDRYKKDFKNKGDIHGHYNLLPVPPELIDFAKVVLGWIISNTAWDLLKMSLKHFRKNKEHTPVLKDDKSLRIFVNRIKKGLVPIKGNKKVVSAVKEEVITDYLTKLITKVREREKKLSKKEFKKELAEVFRKEVKILNPDQMLNIAFSLKEKESLKKTFLRNLERSKKKRG